MLDFPQSQIATLQDAGTRLLESRKPGTELEVLARALFTTFYDACMRLGLDGLLVELEEAHTPLDVSDPSGLSEHPTLFPALVAALRAIDIDGGGPRNAKPRQLIESLVAALGLQLVADSPDRDIALDGQIRADVVAAITGVVDSELALPKLRDSVIAKGRSLCEERYYRPFDQVAAQLDERGMRITKIPKVPVDALHAIERVLVDARNAVLAAVAQTALDRAKAAIEKVNPAAAARIDQPVSHTLTPREIVIRRICDPRMPKLPAVVGTALIDGITELARFAWRAAERPVRTYGASQTFAVGELIEHPKFGRGSVVALAASRIDVEFPDGMHTLVHKPK